MFAEFEFIPLLYLDLSNLITINQLQLWGFPVEIVNCTVLSAENTAVVMPSTITRCRRENLKLVFLPLSSEFSSSEIKYTSVGLNLVSIASKDKANMAYTGRQCARIVACESQVV
jgi:hypothetical protein